MGDIIREISITEFLKIPVGERLLLDMRKEEDFRAASLEGSVNLPSEVLEHRWQELPAELPLYILCYTGTQGHLAAEFLKKQGIDVTVIGGGFRSFLRLQLEKATQDPKLLQQRTREIEHSIIKKFRKPVWRKFTKAITEYQLIQPGDRIAVCISGGKDSMLMAKLFQEIQKHGKIPFELEFLMMNPGYNEENRSIIQNNAKILGIPLTVFETEIFDVVAEIEENPCYLCARMRRGYLYANAKRLGCNKIALGHHFDDVIETILMGMLYSGKIETMMPKLHSLHFEGMELIRPMYLIKEEAIKSWRDYNGLHFIQCACRFTEQCESCGTEKESKRDEMKRLIRQFRETSDVIETNIFNSVKNINLRTVIGYHKNDQVYHFLDDYDSAFK